MSNTSGGRASGPYEPAARPRPGYEGTEQYDDRPKPETAEAAPPEAGAPTPAAPVAEATASASAPPPASTEASLRVLPVDLDQLLAGVEAQAQPAAAPQAAAEPGPTAPAAEPAAQTQNAAEASLKVLPVDIEALLGKSLD